MITPSAMDDPRKDPHVSAHPLLLGVFDAFERRALRWSLLPALSDAWAEAQDAGLLVAREDRSDARALLVDLGFVPIESTDGDSNLRSLAYSASADEWIWIDLMSRLSLGPLTLQARDVEELLERRQSRGATNELHPDDAFWMLLLSCLLKEEAIPQLDADRLQRLASRAHPDGVLARRVAETAPEEWDSNRIIASVQQGDWAALDMLRRHLLLDRAGPRAGKQRAISGFAGRVSKPMAPSRRGLAVALLAPDGAGKSTVAAGLVATLPLPVRLIYMGRARESRRGRRGSVASGLVRQWGRHLTGRWHRSRGRLVLFDRYTYDALLPPRRSTRARVARRWLFAHALPPPDLVVLLDAPADLMFRRKGEHAQDFLEQRRRDYLDLRSRLPQMVVVDAAGAPDRVRRDVTAAIWAAYAARATPA